MREGGDHPSPAAVSGRTDRTERLRAYLATVFGSDLCVVQVDRVEGGWSRQLHRVVVRAAGAEYVLALRGEVDDSLLDTDIEREWRLLRALAGSGIPLPQLHAFEEAGGVLGHRFIVMDWVEGLAPNPWRRGSVDRLGTASQRAALAADWINDIAALHQLDPELVRERGIDRDVDAATHLDWELQHWAGALRSATHHPGALVEAACVWLERNRPASLDLTTVVHGDLRIGNMLVDDGRIVAFLDWEMGGLGDWRVDLGYALMPYHAGKLLEPIEPSANALVQPAAFIDQYLEATGRDVSESELVYFMVLGCVKMIAILCRGVDVYMDGRSRDPRLAWNAIPVPGLTDDVWRLIKDGLPW